MNNDLQRFTMKRSIIYNELTDEEVFHDQNGEVQRGNHGTQHFTYVN